MEKKHEYRRCKYIRKTFQYSHTKHTAYRISVYDWQISDLPEPIERVQL